jgi:hypothetical protein
VRHAGRTQKNGVESAIATPLKPHHIQHPGRSRMGAGTDAAGNTGA